MNLLHRTLLPTLLLAAGAVQARCLIQDNNTGNSLPRGAHHDVLFDLLSAQPRCPENALIFRDLVLANKLKSTPAMVANRGFHNPLPQGSFSFFETITGSYDGQTLVPGDWFFGHFTAASIDNVALTSTLSPQQAATPDNLLLETLVWDPDKGAYNFYEIRGSGQGGVWFYRGDSYDIAADITNLHRAFDPAQPVFMGPLVDGKATGPRLRCSGCHMNGGPVMKELSFPHDSWWRTERPLDLGALRIAPEFRPILAELVSAETFSGWVKAGVDKLLASPKYQKFRAGLTLQEQLRPLFCEQEVNLASDLPPFGDPEPKQVAAATAFFMDQRLVPDVPAVQLDKAMYTASLNLFQSAFFDYQTSSISNGVQPINQIDADHAFETPVKGHSDIRLVDGLVKSGLIDEKFVFDVLSIDLTRPMFSAERCGLLQHVPGSAPTADWRERFALNLSGSPRAAAKLLLTRMQDASHTPDAVRDSARAVLTRIQTQAALQQAVTGYVRLLAGRRIAVYQDQISQHPQGQIFEPSFRLIFPTMQLFQKDQQQIAYGGVPSQYWLNPETGMVELSR